GPGDVRAGFVGGTDRGSCFHGGRRLRHLLKVLVVGAGPKNGRPLPAVYDLTPMSWRPAAAGRPLAPEATHPQEIISLGVPGPITRNPLDVVSFRFLIWRDLLQRRGRLLG